LLSIYINNEKLNSFKFPWFEVIADGILKDVNFDENEAIIVKDWDYFVKFVDLYANYSQNYKRYSNKSTHIS
jgi:hypothetical protein